MLNYSKKKASEFTEVKGEVNDILGIINVIISFYYLV